MPKPSSKLVKTPSKAVVLEVMPEVNDAQLGAQLTTLFHDAEDGFRRVILFGAAYLRVEQIVRATRGANSPKSGPGAYGFKTWLAEHAPEISETSARRYRDITEALCLKFKIKDPERVFDADVKTLPEAEQTKRARALAFVEDKSMRQIQLELDLTTPKNSERTSAGQRVAASAAKTDQEKDAEAIDDLRRSGLETLIAFDEIGDRWQLLSDAHLKLALAHAKALVAQIDGWLGTPKSQRAAFDPEPFLNGEAEKALLARRAEGSALASLTA